MGNCLFGGMGGGEAAETVIQVVTANGGIMEFQGPVTVGFILEEFPCHAVFKSDDLFWKPLSNHEELHPGVPYLLLPLHTSGAGAFDVKLGHVRSKSIPDCTGTNAVTATATAAAYRMSFDSRSTTTTTTHSSSGSSSRSSSSNVLKRSNTDVFSRYNKEGIWKVKLVISPEQLLEILSQESRTQELIESVRTVAKCGCSSGAASTGFSDQWSVASSRASSKKD
ncbi:hypothetical protein RDABS01_028046 [Bienertia sinuspersici]